MQPEGKLMATTGYTHTASLHNQTKDRDKVLTQEN